MRVDIVLADAAQAINGKAYMLGAGWSVQTGDVPMAVVVFIQVPWDQANQRKEWLLELVDDDAQLVHLPGPGGPQSIRVAGEFEAGRPPGMTHGTPLDIDPVVVNLGPLPLEPGRYVWRFSADGETQELWQRGFTRKAGGQTAGQSPP